MRGVYEKITWLSSEEKANGMVACWAGSHAQGVALAAQKNGIEPRLPDSAPIAKFEAARSYGVEICLVEGVHDRSPGSFVAGKAIP